MGEWLVVAIGLLMAAPGNIDDRVAVLPVISPSRAASASEVHRAVGHAVRRRMHLDLLSAEEIFVADQEGLTARVKDCGPDVPCIARRLRALRARWGLVIVLDRTLSPAVLGLQLIDTNNSELIGRTVDELGDDESALKRIENRSRELLTRAGYAERGRIVVQVEPAEATVKLSGDASTPARPHHPVGRPEPTWTLPAGQYQITASHPDFVPQSQTVDVHNGREARLIIMLEEEKTIWSSPWLWVAVGVVVAGAVTATALATSPADSRICVSYEGRPCN